MNKIKHFCGMAMLTFVVTSASADWKDKLKSLVGDDEASQEQSISGLSEEQTVEGLKQALSQGVKTAIDTLGVADGFWADDLVRVPVPEELEPLVKGAKKLGADRYVEDFQLTLNRAAEKAVPAAAEVFAETLQNMTVEDAVGIVRGPDDAATQYFRSTSGAALRERFLPIVTNATNGAGVTQSYKKLRSKGGRFLSLLGSDEETDLDAFVTDRALDGLFHYVAVEEKKIRDNPLARSTELLKALFAQ